MSETNLNVRLSATDGATPSVRQLQASVKTLEQQLAQLGAISANASAVAAAGINREIAATREKIAALQQEIAIKNQSSAAGIRASMQEAEYINRNMDLVAKKSQQQIAARNAVAIQERRAVEDSARYEAQSIALGMSRREAATRSAMAAHNARVRAEQAAEDKATLAAQITARAEAEHINNNMNLRASASRAEAEHINRDADLRYAAMRAEADYMNRDFDLRAKRSRVPVSGADSGDAGLLQRESRHIVGLFDSMARGQRGQAISSLGAAARDAGLGVAGLATSMGVLVAIAGTTALLHAAENMGKWATETRAAAAATGMSLRNYSSLQGALSLIGVKAESADTTLRRLSVNLAEALADPASKAAEAFHNLGISQEALVKTGGDTGAALKLLADAFQRTADGANKSENMNELFGRGFEKIIPLLQQGSAGIDELTHKAQMLGVTLDESGAAKLEAAGRAVEQLGQHIRGDAITAFEAWSPIIVGVSHALENMLSVLTRITSAIGAIVAAPAAADNWLSEHIPGYGAATRAGVKDSTMRGYFNANPMSGSARTKDDAIPKAAVPPLTTPASALDTMRAAMAQAAQAAGAGATTERGAREAELRAEIGVMKTTLETATLNAKQKEELATELANKEIALHHTLLSASAAAAKQSYADFASAEKLKISEAEGSAARIKEIYQEWASAASNIYKQHASVVLQIQREMTQALNKAKLNEFGETERVQDQQTKLMLLNARLAALQSGGGSRAQARGEGPAMDYAAAAAARKEAADVEALAQQRIAERQKIVDSSTQGSDIQRKAQDEINSILIQSKEQEVALYQKAADATQMAVSKIVAPFTQMFDRLGSEFESFTGSVLKSLIAPQQEVIKAGLTTIHHSMRGSEISTAIRNLFMNGIQSATSAVQNALGQMLARTLSGGASNTLGELVGNSLSKVVTSVFPSLAGSLGGGAVASAPTVAAVTAGSASIVGAITASTSAIVSAVVLASANPEIAGFKFNAGGIVPSAAGGMVVGGTGGSLAILHAREMVLPAQISQGLQSLIANTTNNSPTNNATLNYAPTINTGARSRSGTGMTRGEFAQLLSVHGGALLGEARNMVRSGWRPS